MPRMAYVIPSNPAPVYSKADGSRIDLLVIFPEQEPDPVSYTAAASDPHWPHSEEIFARAAAGEFGPVAPFVPRAPTLRSLTQRQFRLALVGAGIAQVQVDAAIAAIPDPVERETASIEWQFASEFRRDHPLIDAIGGTLGLTSAQIDAIWLAAQGL